MTESLILTQYLHLGGKSYGWVGGGIWDTGLGLDFGLGSWDLVFLGMTS